MTKKCDQQAEGKPCGQRVEWTKAVRLSDLFAVFDRLEKGATIALEPVGGGDVSATFRLRSDVAAAFKLPPHVAASFQVARVSGVDSALRRKLAATSSGRKLKLRRKLKLAATSSALGVFSSGSTGQPKLAWRSWPELKAEIHGSDQLRGWTWASPFLPCTFAGVQVALQAWGCAGKIISLNTDWPDCWRLLRVNRVEGLSCTPTFIDLLLQEEPNRTRDWQPRQITLGGEVLRPQLGQRLAARFPAAHFTVVYAAAEFGVLLKTHRLDGWYEPSALVKRYAKWRINADQLEVWRNDSWLPTGDLVEQKDDLIRVIGRADAVANVAGTKVSLAEIAGLAEEVPGVRRAVAVAEPNQIAGQIVCLRFCPESGNDPKAVQKRIESYLREHLGKAAWPRRWELDPVEPVKNAKRAVPASLDE